MNGLGWTWHICNPGDPDASRWRSFEPKKAEKTRTESSSREEPARKRAKPSQNTQIVPQHKAGANSNLQITIPRGFSNCTIRVEISEPSGQSSSQTSQQVRKWTRLEPSQVAKTSKRVSGSTWVPPWKHSSNAQTVAPAVTQSTLPSPSSIGFLLNPSENQATFQEPDEAAALALHGMASVTAGAEKPVQAKMRVSTLLN